ncbi:MAG TPA: CBS domain-containing protein [Vicinamibacterales bacterium]|nr:CBS domain-containing protein [Vicinamibacterales bacterium]
MRVKELMTQPVYSCSVQDHANEAAQIMWEHDCGVVPVIDGGGRVVGVLTDRDLCMAAHFQNRTLTDIPVADVMAQQVCTCGADDDVVDAERLMAEKQIHRLPVVSASGSLIGILSLADVARQTRNTTSRQRDEAVTQLANTVTAISEPHRPTAAGSRAN